MLNKIKNIFKKGCHFCNKTIGDAIVEISTSEGKQSVNICDECAFFFEKSIEVVESKGKKGNEQD